MASIFENKDRRVIPNWRSFRKTASLGELSYSKKANPIKTPELPTIDEYIFEWKENQTLPHAGDLLSAAISNGMFTDEEIRKAATFIISNKDRSTVSQLSLAKIILSVQDQGHEKNAIESLTADVFDRVIKKENLWRGIRDIRRRIVDFPYNPLLYVELSRLHSVIGQESKAIDAMRIALHLSPENRFILRSAVRLFAHYDDLEFSHDLLRKNTLTNYDPWLTSAEIAISTIRGRSSRFIKRGLEMINSKEFHPFSISELASAIATVELLEGNNKKSRVLFNTALISPNDNTLAQVEWASMKDSTLDIDPLTFHVKSCFEAQSIDDLQNKKYAEALDNTFRWFVDIPFSKRPIMQGAHIAGALLDDQQKNREFLHAGLISHPNDPQIINNLVYSFAIENKIKDAKKYLDLLSGVTDINIVYKICLIATRGLIFFRSGMPDVGRQYYITAIKDATAIKSQYLGWLAILNWAREEIICKSSDIDTILDGVSMIPDNTDHSDINKLKSEVIAMYKKSKKEL